MPISSEQLQAVAGGSQEGRVEALRRLLGYPVKQRDPQGSRFWFIRPGADETEAEETCPIAVGFYVELNSLDKPGVLQFLTADEQQNEIYGHYVGRIIPEQPVMYLLLPEGDRSGRVAMILPSEGKLRRRQIESFAWTEQDLLARLNRLRQSELARTKRMQNNALSTIPLVEWAFYKPIETAKELAEQLAEVSRKIEQAIPAVYDVERPDGYLHNLLTSFQRELLPTLRLQADNDKDYSFADIYAQTISYGLFTARVFSHTVYERKQDEENPERQETDFNRQNAWERLPETNPFLRRLFKDVSQQPVTELGEDLADAIAEIFSILRAAKMDAILADFRAKMNQEDIVIRFYEDFLAAYKPKMRERRGVYYTPEPVVSYMVRSVDILLKEKFNKPLGLADPEVMILDPACGTGTFLLWIFQEIHRKFEESPELLTAGLTDKSWSGYVKERLLPRIFGFELLMAPYAIAHLKLGLFLEETGYQFDGGKRLGIYLTDSLDNSLKKSETLFEEFIAEEADQALEIKRNKEIMVVVGNPPYSYASSSTGEWIRDLVRDYYQVDGKPLGERNPKGLLDDYVKFIRFGQWRISRSKKGILALITNHGFLNNSTFRGMRQQLMTAFSDLRLYDLHGNSKKKERSPDGSLDQNVFDIQQGTSITFGIISTENISTEKAVFHSDLYGSRVLKYETLLKETILSKTDWTVLKPSSPSFFFYPQNTEFIPEYEQGWKITDVMPLNSTGARTHRDYFVMNFDLDNLRFGIEEFRNISIQDGEISKKYGIEDTRDWKISLRRKSLSKNENWEIYFTNTLYRPFDIRYYYHHEDVVEFPRNEIVGHLLVQSNFALLWTRPLSPGYEFSTLVSDFIPHQCVIGNKNAGAGASYIAPLYIYPDLENPQQSILNQSRSTNFSDVFLLDVKSKIGYVPSPEVLLYYIYAIFYSPTYRIRYAEFLKSDFPRVPLTSNDKLFRQLAAYGEELVALHLMKSPKLDTHITQFVEAEGNCTVDPGHPKYNESSSSVLINRKGDKFTGVPKAVWEFYVGGYQVCQKWLKDRKGRTLSEEDITHYQRIVVALQETIRLMQQIDEAIPSWPIE